MSSEPQVTSSTATQNSTERILTRRQADLLPVYEVVGRWLHREPAFLHENEPEHHLEELAQWADGRRRGGTRGFLSADFHTGS